MAPALTELVVGDEPSAWETAGFAVDGHQVIVGGIALKLAGTDDPRGRGVIAWAFDDLEPTDHLDGVPVVAPSAPPTDSPDHPNGVSALDHVVVVSPDLRRTTAALESVGIHARRTRDVGTPDAPRQQVFFWIGETILELVGPADPSGDGPSRVYGLALTVADLDHTAATLGDRVGRVKDAVQPGRRITTLRHRDLGMSVPVAFMSAHTKPNPADA